LLFDRLKTISLKLICKRVSVGSAEELARRNSKPLGGKMASFKFNVNGKAEAVDAVPEMPLLWVLRDLLGMTGTKFGCGMALCGACTVHVDGNAVRACQTQIARVQGRNVTTIEGLSADGSHPVQQAWIEIDVPQCGYCQSGQIMQAASLLAKN